MSKIRPELVTGKASDPVLRGGSAYLAIYNAVQAQRGLYHGKINGPHGEHCAVGSYFALAKRIALDSALVDEVAAINDSMPMASDRRRKTMMLRWLRWKLGTLGMPGFLAAKKV